MQQELVFFPKGFPSPTGACRSKFLDVSNPKSPYYGFKGNHKVITRLQRIDFDALGFYNHFNPELNVNIAIVGPAGCGKTDLVRRHNAARGLPFVEISPKAVRYAHDIFVEIAKVCVNNGVGLVELGHPNNYILPPIDVFIDEVHALSKNIVQGLLKATEGSDGQLVTERGFSVNCRNVHWIIATTDRGKLFDAFDTRFIKLQLHLYDVETMTEIVQIHYPDWPVDVCRMVAHYSSRVPREALAFAREMQLEHNMLPDSWKNVAERVANDNEIDEYGMTYQRLAILKALGQGPIAEKRLPIIVGCKAEELEKFIMPWLLESTPKQDAYVTVSTRGYCITEAGIVELDKRKILHKKADWLLAA